METLTLMNMNSTETAAMSAQKRTADLEVNQVYKTAFILLLISATGYLFFQGLYFSGLLFFVLAFGIVKLAQWYKEVTAMDWSLEDLNLSDDNVMVELERGRMKAPLHCGENQTKVVEETPELAEEIL